MIVDTFDASTLGSSGPRRASPPLATLRFVFRGSGGIVEEPSLALRPGVSVVGRARDDEVISLPDDGRASRRHAELYWRCQSASLRIRDCDSRNGISVNGRQVREADLSDGDVVRFGNSFAVIRFVPDDQLDVPHATLLGASPAMQRVRVAVARFASQRATVLIAGETGVGKELVARALHQASGRSGPFVAVNCTGLTPELADSQLFGHVAGAFTGASGHHHGFFAAARGGTLLLDEVGDMSLAVQPKLLRALETGELVPVGSTEPRPFDARIVAATNVKLEQAVLAEHFREDLYARLAQLTIGVPPLRERREDILLLLAKYLPKGARLSADLVNALLLAHWPRNVRELIALASELAVWAAEHDKLELEMVQHRLAPAHFAQPPETAVAAPAEPGASQSSAARPQLVDKPRLLALLAAHHGNVAAIAQAAGRSRAQIYRLLRKHQLDVQPFRDGAS